MGRYRYDCKTFLWPRNIKNRKLFQNKEGYKLMTPNVLLALSFLLLFLLPMFGLIFIEKHVEKGEVFSVVVDTKKITADFSQSLVKNRYLTEPEKGFLIKKFDRIYSDALKTYADKNDVIIFDKSIPIQIPKSAINITNTIESS